MEDQGYGLFFTSQGLLVEGLSHDPLALQFSFWE